MTKGPKTVLIVDSSVTNRESLTQFFTSLGHDAVEAHTGLEALEKSANIQPELIMMAVCLPGLNGDEVMAKLKRNVSTRRIPIVINTGWSTESNSEERVACAVNSGAAEVLYKPSIAGASRCITDTHGQCSRVSNQGVFASARV